MLFLVRTTAGQPRVLNLEPGTIIDETGFMSLTSERPSEDDLLKMTKAQLCHIVEEFNITCSNQRGRHVMASSLTKPQLTSAILRGWDTIFMPSVERVSEAQASSSATASTSAGYSGQPFTGTAHQLSDDADPEDIQKLEAKKQAWMEKIPNSDDSDNSDASSNSNDGDNSDALSISDFFDPTEFLTQEYLTDPSCFDSPSASIMVKVFEFKGKCIMSLPVEPTIEMFKSKIVEKIEELNADKGVHPKKTFTEDAFVLQFEGASLNNDTTIEELASGEHHVSLTLLLRLKGGGVRSTYLKKNSRDERLFSIKGRFKVVSYPFPLAEQAKAQAEEMMNSSTGAVTGAINRMDLPTCQKLMEAWENGQSGGDRFAREVAPIFCPALQNISDVLEKRSEIHEMLETAFMFIFAREFINNGGRYMLTDFKEAVSARMAVLERLEMNSLVQQALASKGVGKGNDIEM